MRNNTPVHFQQQQRKTQEAFGVSGSGFDHDTANKMRQLEMDKQIAVSNENFELAKHLKLQIDRLRSVSQQLQ